MELGTGLCQRVGDGATGHVGNLLALNLTHVKLVSVLMVVAIDNLIIEFENSAGVVDERLAVG